MAATPLRLEVPNSNPPKPAGRTFRGPVVRLSALALAAFALSYLVFGYGVPFIKKAAITRPPGMVWIPGGEVTMGTDDAIGWADEKPAHRVRVDGFWVDQTDVTNAQFRAFVEATGYVTTAEKPVDAQEILRQSPPGTPMPSPEKLLPGSLVFQPTAAPVKDLRDFSQWWHWTPGATGGIQ